MASSIRNRSVALLATAAIAGLTAFPCVMGAAGDPCALLTPGELQQVVGQSVTGFKSSGPGICSAVSASYTVMLRLAERKGGAGAEEKGIAVVKQMGGQVDVKTFGPMTCSTVVPPASMVQAMGFNTTCSILKGGWVAAVEITAKAQKDVVSIEKLRPVAEKMAPRF